METPTRRPFASTDSASTVNPRIVAVQNSFGAGSPMQSSPMSETQDESGGDSQALALNDEANEVIAREQHFYLLLNKFPSVFIPFIRALRFDAGVYAFQILANMDTYMQTLPRGFRDFDVSADDPQDIYLLSDLCLYAPREDGEGGIFVSKGHHGRIIPTESNTFTVQWRFRYNGWAYIGRVLEHAEKVSPTDIVVEEITLLISDTMRQLSTEEAIELLESICENLSEDNNVLVIIGRILTIAMQRKNIGVSVAALEFFAALTRVLPSKVWEFLENSTLLDRSGNGGMAAYVLSSVEIINGDYKFTLALIDLVCALTNDVLIGKFTYAVKPSVKAGILLQLFRHLMNVYESFSYWKYEDLHERLKIATRISEVFESIIRIVYCVDEFSEGTEKINGVLFPATQHILDRFLVTDSKPSRCLQPLLGGIEAASRTMEALKNDQDLLNRTYGWIESSLSLAEVLTRARSLLKRAPTQLERKLFGLAASMSVLFANESVLRLKLMQLLNAMVASEWSEKPSLLAYFGSGPAAAFAASLVKAIESDIDYPMQNEIANFVSLVFSTKQQGLSILLLTGKELGLDSKSESEAKKEKEKEKGPVKSLLQALEKKAQQTEEIRVEFTANILESLALAQNTLSTALFESQEDKGLLNKILKLIDQGTEGRVSGLESSETIVRYCYETLRAARGVQLCAVHLHKARKGSSEAKTIISHIVGNLPRLADVAFRIYGYRASLHGNLHRNFDKKWPEARLIRFQRTVLVAGERKYGTGYKYDVEMMDMILGADPIWSGYKSEVEQANLNLSLIDAQSHLFRAWWLLTIALLDWTEEDGKLASVLEEIACKCLTINIEEGVIAPLFQPIVNERCELAFIIIQKLAALSTQKSKSGRVDFKRILRLAHDLIVSGGMEFVQALTEGRQENYRPVLRLLLLSVQELRDEKPDAEITKLVHDLIEQVVARSYSVLGPDALDAFRKPGEGAGEDGPMSKAGEDMLLLTSLLRDCLNINGVV
ncbi:nucleoporin subcomplex protein binding to Pom34-domain-containing protein [Myxozyma melibiosi]|uniref:Nucleoporin subcomplex protein binding to Pom34-domain-containing protein n=1 Tax=Myxozyma melibiosi TaxID=54550 RepID=A0ABR1FBX1_9ASCO